MNLMGLDNEKTRFTKQQPAPMTQHP